MAIAVFAFFGVIVGASLQYLFTRLLEERKHRQSLQTEAYTDYIRAVAEARHLDLHIERASITAKFRSRSHFAGREQKANGSSTDLFVIVRLNQL